MANVIEIVIKAVDSASKVIASIESNITGSTKNIVKNFDDSTKAISEWDSVLSKSFAGVGLSAENVSKKLGELGAATSDAARVQHELEKAQADTVVAAQRLAAAQKELIRNTDPGKEAELAREVSAAQVALDRAGDSVKKYSDKLSGLNDSATKSTGGFGSMQAAIVTANQGLDLLGRGFGIVKDVIEQTIGSTLEYSKQVRNLSANLGISTEETSKIIQASNNYGVSIETVTNALQMAVQRGFAPNIETLAKLADEYNNISDPTERAARLTEVFGRNWSVLTPMLKEGGQALRDAANEAAKLGLVLSDEDVQAARALEVQVNNLNEHVDALKQKIGKGLVPELSYSAEGLVNFISMLDGTATSAEKTEWQIGFLNRVFGEGVPITANAINKLQEYQKGLDSTAQTVSEKAVRANMAQVQVLGAVQTSMSDLNRGIRNQAEVYSVLDEAMDKNLAKQKLMASISEERAKASAFQEYQSKMSGVEVKGDEERLRVVQQTMDELAKLEANTGQKRADIISQFASDEASRLSDLNDKRIDILMGYSENEQKITEQQYKDRMKLARDFGVETERMEQDHQRQMERMGEDHTRNLRKLADSRDALAIEDEQESYQIERRRAEEDYQVKAAQRNEDYARQLAEQNAAFEEQRRQRAADRDKQLADLQKNFDKQDVRYKAAYSKQLDDLDKQTEAQRQAIWDAEGKKMQDIAAAQALERVQALSEWTTWRNQHEIFFAGERQLYDDYLKYTYDQLQTYINKGGAAPATTTTAPKTIIPGRGAQQGANFIVPAGFPNDSFPMRVSSGERVSVTPAGRAGNMPNINITQSFSGAQVAPEQYKAIMYEVITDVIEQAMRQ